MIDVCNIIKILLKYKRINTDNNVFRLHYKFTVALLLLFAFLVTCKQFFGDPIDCETDSKAKYVMDTYCWIYSTFTVKAHLSSTSGSVYPGVGPFKNVMLADSTDEIIVQKYYQWVCLVLFFQAAFFYLPKYLWDVWEAGRIRALVKDFDLPVLENQMNKKYKTYLIYYMRNNKHIHSMYLLRFSLCEILNLCNVVLQIFAMDWFLGGLFSGYGIAVALFKSDDPMAVNPMSHVFPKLAKCTYENFGPSGSIQSFDALCVLPLNVINEKIYVVLWFWFIILAFISVLAVFYRVLLIASPKARTYLLLAQSRLFDKKSASKIVSDLSVGDWFILHQLGRNMNPTVFHELIFELYSTLDKKQNYIFQFAQSEV